MPAPFAFAHRGLATARRAKNLDFEVVPGVVAVVVPQRLCRLAFAFRAEQRADWRGLAHGLVWQVGRVPLPSEFLPLEFNRGGGELERQVRAREQGLVEHGGETPGVASDWRSAAAARAAWSWAVVISDFPTTTTAGGRTVSARR